MHKSPDDTPVFLIVDHNADSRFLLVKCLLRKFPNAKMLETDNGDHACELGRAGDITAIISHRTNEMLGTKLISALRAANPDVPLIMVSGIDRTAPAMTAGADRFLLYDEWLRIGTVVHELLDHRRKDSRQQTPA